MEHRIRLALRSGRGRIEVDETFIGQKGRNVHKIVKAGKITGDGGGERP
jgi:hypothetical protein